LSQPPENPLRPEHFAREDELPDPEFYREARLVTHIDDAAIVAASNFYGQMMPEGGVVLDLMSSWVSHLPQEHAYAEVVGLGMNDVELSKNAQLNRWVVHDLNKDPRLPFDDDSFDGAIVTVSVQYLTSPVEVFADVGRVLKAGAPFILTYSNRCFPTKAVAIWRVLDDREHADLIALYFRLSAAFTQAQAIDLSPNPGRSDPLYAVYANVLPKAPRAS
jgi:SAM-dependent methyltransferase